MNNIRRYNPRLNARLRMLVAQRDHSELLALLESLSNSDARTAGFLLGETILAEEVKRSEDFWQMTLDVVTVNSKAYLGTFLKAARNLYKIGVLSISDESSVLEAFARQASAIDCRKVLSALLPVARRPEEIAKLLRLFCEDSTKARADILLQTATPMAYYMFFRELKALDADKEVLRLYAVKLIKKSDPLSFNLAGIISLYFDVRDIPGRFSLHLEPYELSRLENSPEQFLQILQS